MDELTQRVNRAAESILENEALTADLDDSAAQVLLDWGVACAKTIARGTVGLSETEAEELMSPRLRATRRLIRRVNKWVANRAGMDLEAGRELVSDIVEQAATIYGDNFRLPDDERREAFLKQTLGLVDQPAQMIANLRMFIEGNADHLEADSDERPPGGERRPAKGWLNRLKSFVGLG